jgi:hypothetical protein
MATNKEPIFLNVPSTVNQSIANADTTTAKVMATAGADGGAVMRMSATTTDTSDVIAVLTIDDGSVTIVLGEVTVPAGAGTDGSTPAVNLLSTLAMPGAFQNDGSLILGPAAVLSVGAKATVTSTKTLDISAQGGDYSV